MKLIWTLKDISRFCMGDVKITLLVLNTGHAKELTIVK